MVNYYSGFVVPESARRMARMFDVRRELREKYSDDEEYERAVDRWRKANPIEPGTIHDVLDHIEHIIRVAGVDHVGIGSDYDGVSTLPDQLEDVSTYPLITQGLLDRGHSINHVRRILGGNVLRVLRDAEQVADRLRPQSKDAP